jgi:hypothetical protein
MSLDSMTDPYVLLQISPSSRCHLRNMIALYLPLKLVHSFNVIVVTFIR